MSRREGDNPDKPTAPRRDRLAEQLRANLQRRKAQARARRAGGADDGPEGSQDGEADAEPDGDDG